MNLTKYIDTSKLYIYILTTKIKHLIKTKSKIFFYSVQTIHIRVWEFNLYEQTRDAPDRKTISVDSIFLRKRPVWINLNSNKTTCKDHVEKWIVPIQNSV